MGTRRADHNRCNPYRRYRDCSHFRNHRPHKTHWHVSHTTFRRRRVVWGARENVDSEEVGYVVVLPEVAATVAEYREVVEGVETGEMVEEGNEEDLVVDWEEEEEGEAALASHLYRRQRCRGHRTCRHCSGARTSFHRNRRFPEHPAECRNIVDHALVSARHTPTVEFPPGTVHVCHHTGVDHREQDHTQKCTWCRRTNWGTTGRS